MNGVLLGVGSLVIALIAVVVAIWQVRASAASAESANSLPVVSEAFKEFRSREFQTHLRKVWDETPSSVPEGGFQSLPEDWRDSAYRVAYFFEYSGVLVAYKLVPGDLVVDFSANLLGRSWSVLKPFIQKERMHRQEAAAISGISPGFVTHFEHLVALTIDSSGKPIDDSIHERLRLRNVPEVVFGDPVAIRAALEEVRESRPTASQRALPIEAAPTKDELRRPADEIESLRTQLHLLSEIFLEVVSTIPADSADVRSAVRVIPLAYYTSSDDPEIVNEMDRVISTMAELSGFTPVWAGHRENGSIFRRFFASSRRALTSDEARDAVTKISRAVELQILDVPQSQVDSALAEGVSKLLTALDQSDTAFVQLGSVIVLKVDDAPIVFNLTQLELSVINREPPLFRDPRALLEKLQSLRATDIDGT